MAMLCTDRDERMGETTTVADVQQLSVAVLARRCREEVERFLRRESSRDTFGLELFRRAVCEHDDRAWTAIFDQYGGLVRAWLQRHPAWLSVDDDADYCVNCTFERFWVAVDSDRFASFPSLAAVLRYLKLCAHSVLLDALRVREGTRRLSCVQQVAEMRASGDAMAPCDGVMANELWNAVVAAAQDEKEILVARLCLVLGMKPGEVYALHPERFADVVEVYGTKRNLLDRLRRNPVIQQFLA
jgi:hypothetical protein